MKKLTNMQKETIRVYIRLFEKLAVTALGILPFVWSWYNVFNPMLYPAFVNKGNIMIIGLYIGLMMTLIYTMGGYKIGVYRNKSVILSQTLGYLMANFFFWIIIILMVGTLYKIGEITAALLLISLFQIVGTALLVNLLELIFHKAFKPKAMIVLYEEKPNRRFAKKLNTREDKFNVLGEMKLEENWQEELLKLEDYMAVLLYNVSSPLRNDVLKFCYQNGIRVYLVPKIADILVRNASESNFFDTPLYMVNEVDVTYGQIAVKRICDIILSLIAIILTSPVMLIAAIAIHKYDGGPVFFRQKRCTRNGRVFEILKFRSMIVDAEKDGKARLATENDDRITPVGHFIRKTRIDELPQFFNILKGDMSFVGPRPERPEIVAEYEKEFPEFDLRMKVKAGLTGYAQVYGKYNTTAYDKLKLDLIYVQKYSLLMDLRLIFMTVKVIFMKESTEGLDDGERIAK
ncbi:MAG: sugar transferase [Lachnospiraceae bacterium]|nr:sugar transferase [Lachnospiraceae bacterium]